MANISQFVFWRFSSLRWTLRVLVIVRSKETAPDLGRDLLLRLLTISSFPDAQNLFRSKLLLEAKLPQSSQYIYIRSTETITNIPRSFQHIRIHPIESTSSHT